MSVGGRFYLVLICVVFLIFVGTLAWGMITAGNPHGGEGSDEQPEPHRHG